MRASRWLSVGFLIPGLAILVVLFVVPLGMVIAYSFGTTNIVGLPVLGFTTENYHQVLQSYYIPTIVRTVEYAALTTVITALLGYPLAYFAARFGGDWGRLILAAIVLTWIVDYLVRIYAWTALLDYNGLVNNVLVDLGASRQQFIPSAGAVLIGLVYGYLPLMVLPIYASLSDLDLALIEAGKDLYGTPRQTFLHVTLPATVPGLVGGAVLTFFPSLGDFATAQFLGGPNQTMIGNLINEQFTESGSIPFGAALTVVLLVLLLVGVAVVSLVTRHGLRQAEGRIAHDVALGA